MGIIVTIGKIRYQKGGRQIRTSCSKLKVLNSQSIGQRYVLFGLITCLEFVCSISARILKLGDFT